MMQRQRSRLLRRQSSSHHHHQQPQQQQQRPSSISSIQRYVCHVVLPVIILYAWAWKQMMFRSTVDSAILLEPQTTTAMSLPSSSSPSLGFPRDPWIRHPDCRVVLKKDNVAARGLWCLRTVQEEDDKWLWPLMERLLEYKFRCKVSTDLLLKNDTAVTSQKNCLFLDREPLVQWDKLQSTTTTTKAESFPVPNELRHLLPGKKTAHNNNNNNNDMRAFVKTASQSNSFWCVHTLFVFLQPCGYLTSFKITIGCQQHRWVQLHSIANQIIVVGTIVRWRKTRSIGNGCQNCDCATRSPLPPQHCSCGPVPWEYPTD